MTYAYDLDIIFGHFALKYMQMEMVDISMECTSMYKIRLKMVCHPDQITSYLKGWMTSILLEEAEVQCLQ